MSAEPTAASTAWQAALAAEQQAVFGYGLLGPRLAGTQRSLAAACQAAHIALRDRTAAAMVAAGVTPIAARADYPALYPVPDAAAAGRLAVRLEDECAVAWRILYLRAASTADSGARMQRASGQNALTDSAVRATRWRVIVSPARATDPFPGI